MNKTSVVDVHKKRGERPAFDVYIGRAVRNTEFTEDSRWRNRFYKQHYGDMCLIYYEACLRKDISYNPERYDLRDLVGKRLGCWCVTTDKIEPLVCHGQVIMKLVREAGLES